MSFVICYLERAERDWNSLNNFCEETGSCFLFPWTLAPSRHQSMCRNLDLRCYLSSVVLGFSPLTCVHVCFRVAGHPLAQNERCLHMFLQDESVDKNYTPSKVRQAWTENVIRLDGTTQSSCHCSRFLSDTKTFHRASPLLASSRIMPLLVFLREHDVCMFSLYIWSLGCSPHICGSEEFLFVSKKQCH